MDGPGLCDASQSGEGTEGGKEERMPYHYYLYWLISRAGEGRESLEHARMPRSGVVGLNGRVEKGRRW
jgi:hypothetical protein